MDDEREYDLTTLDELDTDPVLTVAGRNFLGWPQEFSFFDVHFSYKNLFGKKREVPYNLVESVSCRGGKIYIKIRGKMLPVVFALREGIEIVCDEIRKVTGMKKEESEREGKEEGRKEEGRGEEGKREDRSVKCKV